MTLQSSGWVFKLLIDNMVNDGKIADQFRALVRIAQKYEGLKQCDIMEKFKLSHSTVYRIVNGPKIRRPFVAQLKGRGPCPPRKLSECQESVLLRCITNLRKEDGNFTVKRLMERANLTGFLSNSAMLPSLEWLSLLKQPKEGCSTKHRL